jgi:outer membrane autotransporter protein
VQLDVAPGSDGFADDILTATGGVTGTYDALVYDEDNLVAMIIYPDVNTVSIVAGKTDAIVATTGTVSDAGFVFLENLQEGARREGNLWATGYLYNAENEGLGTNGADFDQDAWGFNAGVDIISEPNLKVGVAVGYMDGDIDIDSATSEAENDGIFGAAYLNYMSDEFYLDGTLMVGQQSIDTTRKLTTGEASGSTNATSYGANLEAGLQLAALGGRLSPFVKMGIHSASIDSYSESGAAGAMRVGEVETQQTRLGAGLRYAIDLGSSDSIQVTPALKVGVTQQWNGGDSSTDVGFVGYAGSTTASLDFEDQATVDLGVSFDVKLSEAVTAFVGWDAALGDESSRNTGTIGLSVSW